MRERIHTSELFAHVNLKDNTEAFQVSEVYSCIIAYNSLNFLFGGGTVELQQHDLT